MRSLYLRLGFILLSLFAAIAVVFFVALSSWGVVFFDEQTQRLNAKLASNIAREHRPISRNVLDTRRIQELFDYAVIVNPSVQAYLLDADGKIVATSVAQPLKLNTVNLQPVKIFLRTEQRFPIVGDDPVTGTRHCVFSAAVVPGEYGPLGYVYVVLMSPLSSLTGGGMLGGSVVLGLGAAFLLACLAFAGITGLLLFRSLTSRLRSLTHAVEDFQQHQYMQAVPFDAPGKVRDEIDVLAQAFGNMSARMVEQIQLLENTDRLRRESVANASHDLRTPLAAMQGYLDTLRLKAEHLSPEQQRHYLEVAARHGDRLRHLVERMFELARLDAPEPVLHKEIFPLDELAADVVAQFKLQAEEKQIDLQLEADRGQAMVEADVGLLARVFENLLDNALRHTPAQGQVLVKVKHAKPGIVTVCFLDTGPGIAAPWRERIFERFQRPDTGQKQGAGLGLAIVKRILELHASDIEVRTAPSGGAWFTFDLPAVTGLFQPKL